MALHSSDPASVYLSAAARMERPTIETIESELYDDPTVIRHHAMRRTLWVMTPRIAEAAHAACSRKIAAAERTKALKWLEGDEEWLDDATARVVGLVAERGPMPTRDVGDALPDLARPIVLAAGTPNEATISGHGRALLIAAFDGGVTRGRPLGSWVGTQYAWSAGRTDLDWEAHDPSTGTRLLVEAWLRRFGPGTIADLTWWGGLTTTAVRTALADLGAITVDLAAGEGYLLPDDRDRDPDPGPWVALLPGLDPAAMGWKQRDWYLGEVVAARVTDRMGNIGPTVWADGRIVGGWVQRPDGEIALDLPDPLPRRHRTLLDTEIDRLQAFLGDRRFRVRFPSPNQRELLA